MQTFWLIEILINVLFILFIIKFKEWDELFDDHTADLKNGIKFKNIFLALVFHSYLIYLVIAYLTFIVKFMWNKQVIKFK
jgi:hypothetical protein